MPVEVIDSSIKSAASATSIGARKEVFRLRPSACLAAILIFILLDRALLLFKPLERLPWYAMTAEHCLQKGLSYKLQTLQSLTATAEVLLLGSSLPMCLAYYSDKNAFPDQDRPWIDTCVLRTLHPLQSYPWARYLASELCPARSPLPLIFNLTSSGCMVSDAFLTLRKSIEGLPERKLPRVLILCLAPRDFIDNLAAEVGLSPQFRLLSDWQSVGSFFVGLPTDATFSELILCQLLNCHRQKGALRALFNVQLKRWLRLPVATTKDNSGYAAMALQQTSQDASRTPLAAKFTEKWGPFPQALVEDLEMYNRRYNPANFARLNKEAEHLTSLIDFCGRRGIHVVLVSMPLTEANKALIQPEVLTQYHQELKRRSMRPQATLIDLDQQSVVAREDFSDSVHLNAQGAIKLVKALSAALRSHPQIRLSGAR